MDKIVINGSIPLKGEVNISGAKTPLLPYYRPLFWPETSAASKTSPRSAT